MNRHFMLLLLAMGAALPVFAMDDITARLQGEIDAAAAAGGGRVVVPAGEHRCGSLRLRSHVELHLEPGARLVGGTKSEDYFDFPHEICSLRPEKSGRVFLYAYDAEDIAITGKGVIDGNGPAFFDPNRRMWGFWAKPPCARPRMVQFVRVKGVRLEGVTFRNSPCWTMLIRLCEDITVDDICIDADQRMINSDGIDFDGCRRIRVGNSRFKTGDDCLILRAMREKGSNVPVVCEDVIVSNCVLNSTCQTIRMGCPSDDTIAHALFKDIRAEGNNGIFFDYPKRYLDKDCTGYMDIHDIVFENFTGEFTGHAVQIVSEPDVKVRRVNDIVFRDFDVKSRHSLRFVANPEAPIGAVTLENFKAEVRNGEPLEVSNADGLVCRNVTLNGKACADGPVTVAWRGQGLSAWLKKPPLQCKDVRLEEDQLKGIVTGRDSQLYADLSLRPLGNQVVRLRLKAGRGGRGQLFWICEGDKTATEAQQKAFAVVGDGKWHDYRIKPGWTGKPLRALRLDLPPECAGDTPFAIDSIVIVREGQEIDVDTAKAIGVAFRLKMPPGQHYCTLVWSGDRGPGEFGFTPATDGEDHAYWFDLREARIKGWGPRAGQACWKGTLSSFSVAQVRYERDLPARQLTFVECKPDLPADPVLLNVRPGEAIPRAGRPFTVEAVVRNLGTRPAEHLAFSFDGLPPGAKVLDVAELTPAEALPGSTGADSIWGDMRPAIVNERLYRIRLSDLGAGEWTFGVKLDSAGGKTRRVTLKAKVLPSLSLAAADYPPEPRPVDTAPYEVGAFLFPGWTSHRWHAVWGHAPWRKPVLGWYDEEKPETVDWQIKHMVENGISYVFVDWYWLKGKQHLNHWMTAFRQAKYRKYLKWSLMWANHTGPGTHSVEDQEKVTRFWIENFFRDPQYQTIDGKPVVSIWASGNMDRDVKDGGCRRLLELSRRLAREAGFPGIHFVAVRGDDERAAYHQTFKDRGFDMTCSYKYTGSVPGVPFGPAGSRPYKWLADTSLRHWRALKAASPLPFLPSLSTAWDDRPWRGETGWEITDINAGDFRRICADAKAYSDETGDRLLLMGPLDEWGEGSVGYPNAELGFGLFEAVRDVFGRKPADGWPVNYAPEDVGLTCPQRSLYE